MQPILIFGGNGQLGRDLVRVFSGNTAVNDVDRCDITDLEAVRRVVSHESAAAVINCAAMTDVPGCESNDALAFKVNAIGAKHVAIACEEKDLPLVHISTDYVFDGNKRDPYVESDLPNPLNVYGLTKLAGEYYVANWCTKHMIVRSSGLYGIHECQGKKTNFVEAMLRLAGQKDVVHVVDDEVLTPTYTLDLAQQIKILLDHGVHGIFHATNNGACSWYEFARAIFQMAGVGVRVERITSAAFGSPVRRPAYSVLQNQRLQNLRIDVMKPWTEALRDYFLDKNHQLTI